MYASDDREKFASELMTPMFEEQLANREDLKDLLINFGYYLLKKK